MSGRARGHDRSQAGPHFVICVCLCVALSWTRKYTCVALALPPTPLCRDRIQWVLRCGDVYISRAGRGPPAHYLAWGRPVFDTVIICVIRRALRSLHV